VLAAVERPGPRLAAVERPRSLRTRLQRARALRSRSLRTRSLQPWKLPGELLSGELRPGNGKLRPRAERPWVLLSEVWLSRERLAARVSGTGWGRAGLPGARLAVAGESSPGLTTVRSAGVPSPGVRSPAVGRRRRVGPARLRATGPCAAVLLAAILPVDVRRAALRPTAGKLARVLHPRLLGGVRPGRRRGLRAAHGRPLRPPAAGRHRLAARSVASGATWSVGRAGTAAQAVVTRTPAEPRTPIPRTFVTRQTGIASWNGAPAGPGVGISPAFVIRPVFGARPPTPAPPPREPCHTIDRKHPGDR
jgi:hypothetical protein